MSKPKVKPKFKAGDKVILCDADKTFTYYKEMHQPGDVVTVADVISIPLPANSPYAYYIKEDKFLYAEEVMEPVSNDNEDVLCMHALEIARKNFGKMKRTKSIYVTDATTLLIAIRDLINTYLDRLDK